jgi:hypothetical protein
MKQITINIPENNYPFLIELLSRLDFVTIDTPANKRTAKRKHPVQKSIEQGLREVELVKKGKLKATPLKDFLDEL